MDDKPLAKIVSLYDRKNGDLARISTLIRRLAHEIRNPLNAQEALTASLRQTKRVDSILSDFIDFTRPKQPDFGRVNIVELISELSDFVRLQAEVKDINISVDVSEGAAEFITDRNLLNQALLNLLLNAIEVTEKGEISLFARIDGQTRDEQNLQIGVEDTGPGFKNSAEVFKPFYSTKNGGTGLGLTAAASIADALGGEVRIENIENGASVFLDLIAREFE